VGPRVQLSGWALDPAGIRAVELRLPDVTVNATTGIARNDVAQVKPGFPQSANGGFEFTGDLPPSPSLPVADRRTLTIVAVANDGRETVLGVKSVIDPAALSRWRAIAGKGPDYHLLPALSGVTLGGAL